MKEKTDNEAYEAAAKKLLAKLQKDPLFDLKLEFGKMLMKHIDDLTPAERVRYYEINAILTDVARAEDNILP